MKVSDKPTTPILTYWDAQRLLTMVSRLTNFSYTSTYGYEVYVDSTTVRIGCEELDREYFIECLEDYVKRESEETCKSLIYISKSRLYRTAFWRGRYYKLCQVHENWAPTLIINGIVMHTLLRDPIEDAKMKVLYLRSGSTVLDTCACLGYTAYVSIMKGARYILSTEIDFNVIEISRLNPYLKVYNSEKVDLVNASIIDIVSTLDSSSFDYILHDPPRLTSETGDLYSASLYREFWRVLKRGGILFHYTGSTGSKYRGLNVARGVAKRLRDIGFSIIKVIEGFGLYARKI